MLLSSVRYNDASELLAPRAIDLASKQITALGGRPTFQAGHYHRFKFQAMTKRGALEKARRFFDLMTRIPGYSTLTLRPYEVRVGALRRYGYEILYVIETPSNGPR